MPDLNRSADNLVPQKQNKCKAVVDQRRGSLSLSLALADERGEEEGVICKGLGGPLAGFPKRQS